MTPLGIYAEIRTDFKATKCLMWRIKNLVARKRYDVRMHETDGSGLVQVESLFDRHVSADGFVARVFPKEHGWQAVPNHDAGNCDPAVIRRPAGTRHDAHDRIQILVGGPAFEPGASRSGNLRCLAHRDCFRRF
jgi:hypothetical protein